MLDTFEDEDTNREGPAVDDEDDDDDDSDDDADDDAEASTWLGPDCLRDPLIRVPLLEGPSTGVEEDCGVEGLFNDMDAIEDTELAWLSDGMRCAWGMSVTAWSVTCCCCCCCC